MPDIPTGGLGTGLFVVMRDFDSVEDSFCGCDLIRAHHQQHIFCRKNAVFCQDIQNGMPCKERSGKVHQIRDDLVARIGPEGGKLKAVAGFLFLGFAGVGILDGVETGGVGVVFGICSIGDDENLHILEQAGPRPEGIPLIAVDLVERLPNRHTPALQLNMHQRQAIDKDGHIVAVVMPCALLLCHDILIDNLQAIVMYMGFINQRDVPGHAVIARQILYIILLDPAGFLNDSLILVGKDIRKEPFPFRISKMVVIQFLQFGSEVLNQIRFGVNGQILVPLFTKQSDKFFFQFGFTLISVRAFFGRFIFGDYRVFVGFRYDVEIRHSVRLLVQDNGGKVSSLSL